MRACVIAAAVVALTQPALAAKAYKKNPHRHAPIESTLMPQAFARTDATDRPLFSDPSFASQSRPASAAFAPRFARSGAGAPRIRTASARDGALDGMIARHAAANGLPVELVHRVVIRESRYNPGARNGSNLGLMQIKHATARGVGYTGAASGLFDAETNLTYAVRYLAGAYRAAGGNANRAVGLYASGYHGRGVPRATHVAVQPSGAWQTAPVALRGDTMRGDSAPGL